MFFIRIMLAQTKGESIMEKKSEVKYPEGGIVKCPCGKGNCVVDEVKLLRTRQRYAEVEIIRLKKILTKCLKINLG